jgi:gliding motility-associated-like protein
VIVPFDVIVNPLPVIDPAFDGTFTFCEDFDGDDTMGSLDFAPLADDLGFLAAPQVTADFTITYHNTQAAADAGFPVLPSPYEVSDGETLFIRIENTATGCLNFTDVTVTVESSPLSMDPDDLILCADNLGINVFPDQDTATFMLNNPDTVADITGGAEGVTIMYYTSLEDAQNMVNAIVNPGAFVNTSNPQTIWASVENDASFCMSEIVSFDLIVEPLPFTDLSDEGDVICVDEITGEVLEPFTVDGTVETPLPDATYDYEWSLNGSLISLDPVVTIDQAGTYQLIITATYDDGTGPITSCSYTAEVVFNPVSAPIFEATVVEASFNTGGLYTVEVMVISSMGDFDISDFEFAIDDGPFQNSTTFTNVTPGTHTVFGRRIGADCNITEIEIGIIDFPRFFTPNNDGFHDTWNIIGIGVAPNLNAKIFIFDRFGKLLKQLSPTSPGWDGTFNGQPMPSNDYWFRVEFTEPDEIGTQRTFQGHFTLKR